MYMRTHMCTHVCLNPSEQHMSDIILHNKERNTYTDTQTNMHTQHETRTGMYHSNDMRLVVCAAIVQIQASFFSYTFQVHSNQNACTVCIEKNYSRIHTTIFCIYLYTVHVLVRMCLWMFLCVSSSLTAHGCTMQV
jgi:hypothetical protein